MCSNQRNSNAHDVCDDALPAHTASRRLKCRKQACQQLRPHRQHMYQHQCRGRGRGRRTASNGLQAMLGHQAGSHQSRKHMDMWTECSIHAWEMWSYEVCARLQRSLIQQPAVHGAASHPVSQRAQWLRPVRASVARVQRTPDSTWRASEQSAFADWIQRRTHVLQRRTRFYIR